jgi:hypothetical protein
MEDKQLAEDIRSSLWHIASSLKGIEQQLDKMNAPLSELYEVTGQLESLVSPNSGFLPALLKEIRSDKT